MIIQENNVALVEVSYKGNENYPDGIHLYRWIRTPEQEKPNRFEVEIYVEGYRMDKDVWLYDTYVFTTLNNALEFYHKIDGATSEEKEKLLNFDGATQFNGWYGLCVEYMKVYEYTPGGKFKWKFMSTRQEENLSGK